VIILSIKARYGLSFFYLPLPVFKAAACQICVKTHFKMVYYYIDFFVDIKTVFASLQYKYTKKNTRRIIFDPELELNPQPQQNKTPLVNCA